MMRLWLCAAMVAACAGAADRPDLNGTWRLDPGHEGKLKYDTLVIKQTDDSVDVTEGVADGKEKALDYACSFDGKECKAKDGTAVSFWFNEGMLVMMESRHGNAAVIKTRLHPSADGKAMNVEVVHIVPGGPNETYTFTKKTS